MWMSRNVVHQASKSLRRSSMACLMHSANCCESVRGLERLLWTLHVTKREEEKINVEIFFFQDYTVL
jgi:hypothetical protein